MLLILENKALELSAWARRQGVHYNTAFRWVTDHTMPVAFERTATGRILVKELVGNPAIASIRLLCMPGSPALGKNLILRLNLAVFQCLLQPRN
jgi:hypothetical protein